MRKLEGARFHIRLTDVQYEALKKLAEQGGYTISEVLRRAIDAYLQGQK